MKRFLLTITCQVELDADQIWPDHDGPKTPTAADVTDLLAELYREPHEVITEWGLEDHVQVSVDEVQR